MIVSLKFIKLTGLSVSKFSKKQFFSQKLAYHAHLEVLSLVKNILRMLDIMLYGTLVKRGWYNEHPSTINLKCNEIFTRGLPKKSKILPTNAFSNIFQVHLNHLFLFTPFLTWLTLNILRLEKLIATLTLEIVTLSDNFKQNTTGKDNPLNFRHYTP